MEVIWVALVAFTALVGLVVVVAGGVVLFLRMRAREPNTLDPGYLVHPLEEAGEVAAWRVWGLVVIHDLPEQMNLGVPAGGGVGIG